MRTPLGARSLAIRRGGRQRWTIANVRICLKHQVLLAAIVRDAKPLEHHTPRRARHPIVRGAI